MDLCLSTTTQQVTRIRVEGRLCAGTLDDLAGICGSLRAPFVLDLSGLLFADAAGVELLKRLRAEGASLIGARPFIAVSLE